MASSPREVDARVEPRVEALAVVYELDPAQEALFLENVGRLSAQVVHDLSNPLGVATIQIHLLSRAIDSGTPEAPMRSMIAETEAAIQRSSVLARELLRFARQGAGELLPQSIIPIVDRAAGWMRLRYAHEGLSLDIHVPKIKESSNAPLRAGLLEHVLFALLSDLWLLHRSPLALRLECPRDPSGPACESNATLVVEVIRPAAGRSRGEAEYARSIWDVWRERFDRYQLLGSTAGIEIWFSPSDDLSAPRQVSLSLPAASRSLTDRRHP